jgi:molybdenum cofactor cytidylyltransferase
MNAVTLPKLQIVVLAAGSSSRLGHAKALARVRSMSLLRKTLILAAPLASATIILVVPPRAARYRSEARGIRVTLCVNPRRAEGLSSSVRRGITQARYSSAVLLLPVDLAALRRRDLARLIARWRATRRRVIATMVGGPSATPRGGAPLILPRWLSARALRVTGDRGLRELVGELPAEQRVLLNLPSAALDIDTPADLRAARHRLRGAG